MKKVQLISLQTTISILYVIVSLIIGTYVVKLKKFWPGLGRYSVVDCLFKLHVLDSVTNTTKHPKNRIKKYKIIIHTSRK